MWKALAALVLIIFELCVCAPWIILREFASIWHLWRMEALIERWISHLDSSFAQIWELIEDQ